MRCVVARVHNQPQHILRGPFVVECAGESIAPVLIDDVRDVIEVNRALNAAALAQAMLEVRQSAGTASHRILEQIFRLFAVYASQISDDERAHSVPKDVHRLDYGVPVGAVYRSGHLARSRCA